MPTDRLAPAELDLRMRLLEPFRSVRLDPDAWTVLRLDGRGFTKFTAARFEKPFDLRFRNLMAAAARILVEGFQGVYGHTHSDEISVLFPPDWNLFSRRLEKLVSVSSGLVSAEFTHACGAVAHFDSRVWQGAETDVVDYFRWRQADAARCAVHGWCYWTLRREGLGVQAAANVLKQKGRDEQIELLRQRGIDINDLPKWQRRGVGWYWETYEKPGYDPLRRVEVRASRRKLKMQEDLPVGLRYVRFLSNLLGQHRGIVTA